MSEMDQSKRDVVWLALTGTREQVGPACANVPVPPTIADDDHFREIYEQAYRHALSDVREFIRIGLDG